MASNQAYVVRRNDAGTVTGAIETVSSSELGAGDVTLRARWSSLNYKDALAATGHPGVVPKLPHVPGIDVAGEIIQIEPGAATSLAVGDEVIVTGFELGAGHWGGWSQEVRVPAEWIVKRPASLSLRDCMVLGTAGLTAALSVDALVRHGLTPGDGEIVVTGATGGVGCLAVKILAKLGYRVVAVTGKPTCGDRLRAWGAAEVVGRDAVVDSGGKPLLAARWAGAVDTVGGMPLATILRRLKLGGCAAACGLVAGTDLPLTIYPFILRGVTLAGIDSAWVAAHRRQEIWNRLGDAWRLEGLDDLTTATTLDKVGEFIPRILAGEIIGRTVVALD